MRYRFLAVIPIVLMAWLVASAAAHGPSGEQADVTANGQYNTTTGVVTDTAGQPVQGALVSAGNAQAVTNQHGVYRLAEAPNGVEIVASAAGFKHGRSAVAGHRADLALDAVAIKAAYLNPGVLTSRAEIDLLVDLIGRTELNALVVDIKENGVYYDSQVAFFQDAGAIRPLYDVNDLLRTLHENDIYAIARLVVFQDSFVAVARPDLAVTDTSTGDPWRDMNGVAWVNPMEPELWEANADLALEAATLGFDEIQYDYVRFPTDGDLTTMDFGRSYPEEARTGAIVDFLTLTRKKLDPTGAKLAADVFGFTLFVDDDLGIGQDVERITPLLDYICPMIYPSHFPEWSIEVSGHPNDFPYETIKTSMERAQAKIPGTMHKVRPWLQDFTLPWLGAYGAADVRAQIDAAEEFGANGWMLWNPLNQYHEDALDPAEQAPTAHLARAMATLGLTATRSRARARHHRP